MGFPDWTFVMTECLIRFHALQSLFANALFVQYYHEKLGLNEDCRLHLGTIQFGSYPRALGDIISTRIPPLALSFLEWV